MDKDCLVFPVHRAHQVHQVLLEAKVFLEQREIEVLQGHQVLAGDPVLGILSTDPDHLVHLAQMAQMVKQDVVDTKEKLDHKVMKVLEVHRENQVYQAILESLDPLESKV